MRSIPTFAKCSAPHLILSLSRNGYGDIIFIYELNLILKKIRLIFIFSFKLFKKDSFILYVNVHA